MAINPYTLYGLYNKGILECVPADLLTPTPMGAMTPMNNPYLDMAMQGGLYNNHGAQADCFQFSDVQSPYVQNYQTYGNVGNSAAQVGSMSNVGGMNIFNGYGVGAQSPHTTAGAFGFNNVIGSQTQAGGMNAFGGFTDSRNGLVNGFNKTVSIINNTPKIVLGILGGIIGVGALMAAFKRGKKPAKAANTSFWSNFNPKNWSWLSKKK